MFSKENCSEIFQELDGPKEIGSAIKNYTKLHIKPNGQRQYLSEDYGSSVMQLDYQKMHLQKQPYESIRETKRPQGRPPTTLLEVIKFQLKELKIPDIHEAINIAQNRIEWRKLITEYVY